MAALVIIIGSSLGAFIGLLGWLAFGLSFGTAFAIYLIISFLLPTAIIVISLIAPFATQHKHCRHARRLRSARRLIRRASAPLPGIHT